MAAATGIGLHFLGFSSWSTNAHVTLTDFAAVLAVVATSAFLDPPRSTADPGGTMRLSFVGEFVTLVCFGPLAMTLVATIGALGRAIGAPPRPHPVRHVLLDVITAGSATQAAGVAHVVLGGTGVPFIWPWQGLPLAAAVAAYCFITCAVADVIAPLATGVATTRAWPRQAFRGCPGHVIGAGIAVALIELVQHHAWNLLPLAAVPFYFAWDAYRAHAERRGLQDRRLDVVGSSDHGVCVVDDAGIVRHWNDALAGLLECAPASAVGRHIGDTVPALTRAELTPSVQDALASRKARTLPQVSFRSPAGARLLHITILPDAEGAMLVWLDVTSRARAEQSLREGAERFALVSEGANDGVWELDESTRSLYVSSRWTALVGLPAGERRLSRDEWLERVHPDDRVGLKKAFEALASGSRGRLEHEHRIRHEDGSYRHVLCHGAAARDEQGRIKRIAGSLSDITESSLAQERIRSSGSRDPLTGLMSRAAFVGQLGQRLSDYKERRSGRFAALFLDLDRFKVVNDSLGHLIGDELLVAVSRRLESCLRPGDTLARFGADEFAVMLHTIGDEMQANVVAFRLQEALAAPFQIGGREVVTSASIGIAVSRTEYGMPDEMMRDADTAMSQAKSHGKARHELFDAGMNSQALDRLGLESDLRHAVRSTGFEVHYQPIVSLTTRMCTGFESLVRWNRNGKAVSPADFIPIAEELGIIAPLGTWVMQQACRKFVEWKKRFPECELDCITVNVSARQLVQQGFIYLVEQTIEQNGMNPADLRLEITETALMDAPQSAARVLAELRGLGVQIYLDDFGTGFSSLSHLHKLPVDALKIDRSFVRGLLIDDRPAMVESILALARTLGTNVVAEGVEEERQAAELERLGCRQAQGYYFSRPVPAVDIEHLLRARQPLGGVRTVSAPLARPHLVPVNTRGVA